MRFTKKDKKNIIFFFTSLLFIIFLIFFVDYVFETKSCSLCITNVTFSCTVYDDNSMSCNPIDKEGNIIDIIKTPCMANKTKIILCDYDIVKQTYISCRELNNTILI
jgi:hypothetical protein